MLNHHRTRYDVLFMNTFKRKPKKGNEIQIISNELTHQTLDATQQNFFLRSLMSGIHDW